MQVSRVAASWRFLIVLAGSVGLVLDWYAYGHPDWLGPLVYFTIQSNLLVACWFAFLLAWPRLAGRYPAGRLARLRASRLARGAAPVYITITGLVYSVVLSSNKNPLHLLISADVNHVGGLADVLLHYVVPPMVVLEFLLAERTGGYRWRFAAIWLCYPLGYLAFALIRGAFITVGTYPYPFLDVTRHGYAGVALNGVEYGIFFWLLGLAALATRRPWRTMRPAGNLAASR